MREEQLPEGWGWKKLSEVSSILGGGTPSRQNAEYFGGNIVWLTPTEIDKKNIKTVTTSREYITTEGFNNSSARTIPTGSVLLTSRASIGYVAIAGCDLTTNQGFATFTPTAELYNLYLAYWLKSQKKNLEEKATGTTFKEIAKAVLKTLDIPLPPLPIQHQIVAKIEELFSELDAGVQELQTALARLKTYRQAVLHHYLSNPDWERVKLGSISETISGFAFSSPDFVDNGPYQVIRMGNIRPGAIRLNEKSVFIADLDPNLLTKFGLQEGDLIITLTGTRKKRDYGYVAQVKTEKNLLLNQRLAAIRIKNPNQAAFYNYALKMQEFQNQFFEYEPGNVGQGNVSIRAVKDVMVPLPNVDTQIQIVSEVEERLSDADALESTIREELKRAENLRQSILKQAFSGRLITGDSETTVTPQIPIKTNVSVEQKTGQLNLF